MERTTKNGNEKRLGDELPILRGFCLWLTTRPIRPGVMQEDASSHADIE